MIFFASKVCAQV